MGGTNDETKGLVFISSVISLPCSSFPPYSFLQRVRPCRFDLLYYVQSFSSEDCSSSQNYLTPPPSKKKKPQTKNQDSFLQACMCGEPAHYTCLEYWIITCEPLKRKEVGEWRRKNGWAGIYSLLTLFPAMLGLALDIAWWELKELLKESNSQHLSGHSQMNTEAVRMIKLPILVPTPYSMKLIGACRALIFLGLPHTAQQRQC